MKLLLLVAVVLILVSSTIGCVPAQPPTLAPTPTQPASQPSTAPASTPSPPPTPAPTTDELIVHFINVGQGDSILIDLGETEVLIDGGGRSPGVVTYLGNCVDGPLEVMVATHPHADHIGGLIAVLDSYQVDQIWLNGDTSTSKTYSEFMSRVNAEGTTIHEARRGQSIEIGSLNFIIIHPAKLLPDDTNNNSIALLLSYGNIDFLFMGDAEKEAEESMLIASDTLVPDVEILKLGHHGSKTASSKNLLDTTKPEIAIFMAREGNSYGHPHVETINALNQIEASVYGTDVYGTIIVITDGDEYEVKLEKGTSPRAPPVISPTPTPTPETITPSPAPTPSPSPALTDTVYVTRTGKKYHRGGCRYLSQSKISIELEEAISRGYTPCSVCSPSTPPESITPSPAPTPSPSPALTDTVYVTRTGKKYHRGGCRYLSQSKISIELEEAISRGYTPCSVCSP